MGPHIERIEPLARLVSSTAVGDVDELSIRVRALVAVSLDTRFVESTVAIWYKHNKEYCKPSAAPQSFPPSQRGTTRSEELLADIT